MKNLFIELSSVSKTNKIFLIDCLGSSDSQTGRKRHEELTDALARRDVFCHSTEDDVENSIVVRFKANNAIEISNAFEAIERCCERDIYPFIMIDGHGDKEKGILFPNNNFYAWSELIANFRKIIELSHGELTVVAAFCYSMQLKNHLPIPCGYYEGIEIYHKMPFSFYYGYDGEILVGKVADDVRVLAECLFNNKGADFEFIDMSKYTELDYILDYIIPLIQEFLSMVPGGECVKRIKGLEISKRRIIDLVEKEVVKERPLSGTRKKTIEHINNGNMVKFMVYKILSNCMHDTDRRRKLIESIEKYIDDNLSEFMATRENL